jgi:hypothetical protein
MRQLRARARRLLVEKDFDLVGASFACRGQIERSADAAFTRKERDVGPLSETLNDARSFRDGRLAGVARWAINGAAKENRPSQVG